ncbi:MAG: MerR family transcriptional regulator [Acidobacteria bacterium]|nr:MAG: MerR family transcriptional regulator [Acidobacteriota bacterium]
MNKTHWKIGELAKRTGVSIRTLHHYDEIGLLSPSHRTESGHRLYGREEVVRLQQILSLRQSGFSLEEIRSMLARRHSNAQQFITQHIARLRQQIAAQQELCARLERIAERYESASAEEFIEAIEVMTMFEKYYTKEQLETLRQRAETLGDTHIKEVEQEWPRLIADVRAEMQKGTDPKDPHIQALATRWMELVHEFTGGDPGITQSLKNLYAGEPELTSQQALDSEIFSYVRKALS